MASRATRPVYLRVIPLSLAILALLLTAAPRALAGVDVFVDDTQPVRTQAEIMQRAQQATAAVVVHDGTGATTASGIGVFLDVGKIVVPAALLEGGRDAGVIVGGKEQRVTAVLAEDRQCGVVLLAVDLPEGAPPRLRPAARAATAGERGHLVAPTGAATEVGVAQAREVPGLGSVQAIEHGHAGPVLSGSAAVNARGELIGVVVSADAAAPEDRLTFVVPASRLLAMQRVGPVPLGEWSAQPRDTRPVEARRAWVRGETAALAARLDDAAAAFESAAGIDPGDTEAWKAIAQCRRAQQRPNESIAVWQRAVAAQPENPRFRHELAVDLSDAGQHGQAVAEFGEVVRLRPKDAQAHFNLGVALAQVGRYEEEYKAYQAALALDPTNVGALRNLGVSCLTLKRTDEAVTTFARAGRLAPADPEIQTGLGLAYLTGKRVGEAITTLRQVVQMAPAFVKARFWLGTAYVANGDRTAARAECEAVRALDRQKGEALCRIVEAK